MSDKQSAGAAEKLVNGDTVAEDVKEEMQSARRVPSRILRYAEV